MAGVLSRPNGSLAGVLSRPNGSLGDVHEYFQKGTRQNQEILRRAAIKSEMSHSIPPRVELKTSTCESMGILKDRPKHRQYAMPSSRIESLKKWPVNKTQNKEDLAAAGFAYTGVDDSVRCYHCNIGLRDWPAGACPWEQHVIASPKCGHVINCKGRAFIKKILGEEQSDSDVDDSDEVIDTVKLAMKRNKEAVDAARSVYTADEDTTRAAVKILIKYDSQKEFTAVELAETFETLQEKREQEEDEEVSETETDGDKSETEEDMEEENRSLKDTVTCKICYDAIACIITLPCGHMVCCPQCVSALTKCAVCREQIKGTVRALMVV